MFLFSSSGFLVLVLSLCSILDSNSCESGQDVSEWMCANENCSEPIAHAVVMKPYTPNDRRKIQAGKGDKLKILRQIPPDSDGKLVYVESLVSKRQGLLPLNYIQERQILFKREELIRTNLRLPGDEPPTPDINPSNINPSAPTTVIDGTTLVDDYGYQDTYASFEPTNAPGSPSESVVQSTTPPSIPASDPNSKEPGENEFKRTGPTSDTPGATPSPDMYSGEESIPTSILSGNKIAPIAEGLDISSTPASIIINAEPSLAPEVPKEADIGMSTTEVPSPVQESEIDRSQVISDTPAQPEIDKPPNSAEEPQEGSGSTPDDSGSGGVWGGLTSMFSLPSGSGEVEDEKTEKSADSSPSDEPSLRRGPSPRTEEEASETEKPAEEPSVKLKSSDSDDRASIDGKAKRSVPDSGESPDNDKASDSTERKEEPVESAKSNKASLDITNPEQGSVDPTLLGQDPGNRADVNPVWVGKLTDAGSEKIDQPDDPSLVAEDAGKTVDPDASTNVPKQESEKIVVSSSEANMTGEDLGNTEEQRNDNAVSSVDMSQEHTQETRVSMSSSHKTDVSGQAENIKPSKGDPTQQESRTESMEVTVETDDSYAEYKNYTTVSDQVQESPGPVEQPSERHIAFSDDATSPPAESVPSKIDAVKPNHVVESEQIVLKIEDGNGEEGRGQAGTEETAKDDLESAKTPSGTVQQVRTSELVASVGGLADEPQKGNDFGLSDLNFVSPMEFVDPRKTNPDLYSSDLPSTKKPVADTQSQWTASVEEVRMYNQWASTPKPSVPSAEPVPSAPPSLAEPVSSEASSEPSGASEVGPASSDEHPTPTSFQEPDLSEDSSEPWYSGIFSVFGGLQDMLSGSSPESDQPAQANSLVTPRAVQVDEQSTCQTDSCDNEEKTFDVGSSILGYYESIPTKTVILMVVTAGAVVIFSLGYYLLENQQRDVELVSKYNELIGKLFIEEKEKETLIEQLASANESMSQISFDTTKSDDEIRDLKALVQKYKEEKTAIEEKEKEANRRRIISDKNYNDLLKTLSMHKQKGERSALSAEVKNLKDRIEAGEINIASLKEQLLEKKDEVKSLNAKILDLGETNQQLERNAEKAISEVHNNARKCQGSISKLEKTIEENTASLVKLEAECTQLKKEKESLANEKELAESSLQKFQQLTPSNALTEWLDAKEVRVSLLAAEKEIKELYTEKEALLRDKKQLEDKWKSMKLDLEQLNENYEKAEREKIDALTKLQVLSDYFKEKETQLQEELGSKEALWLQKQSDDRSIYEQMRALREENTSFKNQNETLKREILEQEASYKKLVASSNEKADEHWVALRHTERRLKEAQMEASQLRSRLSTMGATGDNSADKIKGEVNGDLPPFGTATSPQFMLYPHEFVPPPPLPTTTPSRPPPLGRISSPPPVDFVPPPPLVPFESLFLPPSPPPPVPHAMMNITHKPQPLDGAHHRTQKDSQSSNHSSESTSDRPRRNKR